MIDLTKKGGLPNTIEVGGSLFSIYTDFRLWMKFEISVQKSGGRPVRIDYLFKNDVPIGCDLTELFKFSRPVNDLPRSNVSDRDIIALDFEIDSDLIYSAFLGQYGIDLVDANELHWHKFLALLNGINDSTKLREVIGYRCYKKETRKDYDMYEELKDMWTIEPPLSEEEEQELENFSNIFEREK